VIPDHGDEEKEKPLSFLKEEDIFAQPSLFED